MRGLPVHPVLIAAGGTGGHFFPAEALAAELARRGRRIALMTDRRSGALHSPVFDGREVHVLPGAGLAGRGPMRAAAGALELARGTGRARALLRELRPAAIVGFGGYPSVPPVLAARMMPAATRPAIILHEQNAVLGRANRMLAGFANQLALSFPNTKHAAGRTIVTGNPIRPQILAARRDYQPPSAADRFRLLILGGSLGARVFADLVPEAVTTLPEPLRSQVTVVQQCRAEDMARVQAAYGDAGIPAELSPFFADVAERLAGAHLVVARAGAGTVAELLALARPALLVPLPHAIDGHQAANAAFLADAGAGWFLGQAGLSAAMLSERLRQLMIDEQALCAAASNAQPLGRPHAAEALADMVEAGIELATHSAEGRA